MKNNVLKVIFLSFLAIFIQKSFALNQQDQELLNNLNFFNIYYHNGQNLPNYYIQKANLPRDSKLIIIGDIHSDCETLEKVFTFLISNNLMYEDKTLKENIYIIFLGDFFENNYRDKEILKLILNLYIKNQNKIFLCRGNHESWDMMDFHSPLVTQYEEWAPVWVDPISNFFKNLAYGLLIEYDINSTKSKLLFSHGAIPPIYMLKNFIFSEDQNNIQEIAEEIAISLMWNDFNFIDPMHLVNFTPSNILQLHTYPSTRGEKQPSIEPQYLTNTENNYFYQNTPLYIIGLTDVDPFFNKYNSIKAIFHGHNHYPSFAEEHKGKIFRVILSSNLTNHFTQKIYSIKNPQKVANNFLIIDLTTETVSLFKKDICENNFSFRQIYKIS